MSKSHVLKGMICVLALIFTTVLYGATPDTDRQKVLMHLLKQDCGSCHGLTMQGGLGPALTPQALRDKPRDAMVATILYGRPGTPMPPWENQLTEAEATWMMENLYRGLPNAD